MDFQSDIKIDQIILFYFFMLFLPDLIYYV